MKGQLFKIFKIFYLIYFYTNEIMKKLFIILLLVLQNIVLSNTIPNVWTSSFANGGIMEYFISNSRGQTLYVSCSEGTPYFGNHVSFTGSNGKEYDESKFSLLIDGNAYYLPDLDKEFYTREEENLWVNFREAISKGKKIEVYMNNRSVARFTPTLASIREHISGMYDCPSKPEKLQEYNNW